MAENKTFNAKVVGTVDIKADDASRTMANLLEITDRLKVALKATSQSAINLHSEMAQGDSVENLKKEINKLTGDLKALGMVSKAVKILNVDDVKTASELEARIKQISKAYDSAIKQAKLAEGNLGLDQKDPKKAIADLKKLEDAAKAVTHALSKDPNNAELAKYKKTVEDNTAALVKHINTLRQSIDLEKAHGEALKEYAARQARDRKKLADAQTSAMAEDVSRQKAKDKKLADMQVSAMAEDVTRQKRKEKQAAEHEARILKTTQDRLAAQKAAEERAEGKRGLAQQDLTYRLANSASAQGKLNRDRFDFTETARRAGAYRFQLQSDAAAQMANPVFQAQNTMRLNRVAGEKTLAEIYKNSSTKPEVSGFYKVPVGDAHNAERVAAANKIIGLQGELVRLQQTGQLTDAESLRIRTQITQEITKEAAAMKLLRDHEAALKEDAKKNAEAAARASSIQARAIAANLTRDKAAARRDAEAAYAQRQREGELQTSGRAQYNYRALRLDNSPVGRDAASYRSFLLEQNTNRMADPAFQAQDFARRQRAAQEQQLASIYRQANVRPEVNGFFRSNSNDAARIQAAEKIIALQRQLVALDQQATNFDAESLRLRQKISEEIRKENQARLAQQVRNSPSAQQAQENQAQRNLARVSGIGGASLLAVQASLMANYSVLNMATGAMKTAITGSIELEAAFRNVQAVTATTNTEMRGLEDRIKNVAAASKFTSIEVASAALTLGQAGLSAKEVGQSLGAVTNLASAAGTSVAQAVDLVTSVIGVFDKNASETADIANKVTEASNRSKVSVEKLALGFQYAGNTAAQAGISFEETTAAMAAMSNAGIRSGSTMGTGLRQFIIETQKPSEEFLATINRLGLSMADLDFKAHGLVGVARKLREAGFVASDAIKSFDVRGAAAFNALIANPEELNRQYEALLNTQAGLRANEIQMDSLKAQSTRLKTAFENLAEAGFRPTSILLQNMASGFADVVQKASEYRGVMAGIGILVAGTLTTAFAMHFAGIARGAITLLGLTAASRTAATGMTVLQAAMALKDGVIAGWTALRAGIATVGATITATATGSVSAMGVMSAAAGGLRAALVGLKNAFLGMSAMNLVAGAAMLVGGALYYMHQRSEEAREEMDRAKAASDEARGAFEEKTKTIQSLSEKIRELTYKSQDLSKSQEDTKNTGMSLNAQFGNIGFSVNALTASYGEMIEKLKQVRGEMRKLAEAKLLVALDENKKELTKREEEAEDASKKLKGESGKALDLVLRNRKGAELSQSQVALVQSAYGQMAAGKTPDATTLQNVRSIVSQVIESLNKSPVNNALTIETLNKYIEKIDPVVRKVADLQITQGQRADLELQQSNFKASVKYGERLVEVGGKKIPVETALETLGGNVSGRVPYIKGDKLGSYDEFFKVAKSDYKELENIREQLRGDLNDPKTNKTAVTEALTAISNQMSNLAAQVRTRAEETKPLAERQQKEELRVLNARISGRSKNKQDAAKAMQEKAKLEANFANRAELDDIVASNRADSLEEAAGIRAGYTLADSPGHDRTPAMAAQARIKSLKDAEAVALRRAEADKTEANLTHDFDLVDKLWEDGLKNMEIARAKAIKAMEVEQEHEKTKYKNGVPQQVLESFSSSKESLNQEFAERIRQFTNTFKGFGNHVGRSLRLMEENVKKKQQELDEIKVNAEDKVYKEGGTLEALQFIQALGKRVKEKSIATTSYDYGRSEGKASKGTADDMDVSTKIGPKGVTVSTSSAGSDGAAYGGGTATSKGDSSGVVSDKYVESMMTRATSLESPSQGGSLKQRIAREQIRLTNIQLGANEEAQVVLDKMIEDLNNAYKLADKTFEDLKARIATLEAKKLTGTLTPEEEKQLNQDHFSYGSQLEYVGAKRKELNDKVKERRSVRKEISEQHLTIAKYTEELPQEASLDSLKEKLKDVSYTWAQTVQDMNVTKVFGDGVSAILGNMTGQLGNSFSAILSGTKSVKDAFRDMATGIVKSMLDIMAQMAAMEAMKGLLQMFGMTSSGGSWGKSSAPTIGGLDLGSDMGNIAFTAATGGYVTPKGGIQRFAGGGPVRGGVQGRDSVPAMVMPGEFIMKKSAVDAVGTDYLHSLNQATSSVVSSSAPKASQGKDGGSIVNVWVVSPDQQPSGMGPKDVVVAISDDISRGGSIKKLIKQVAANQI